MEFFQQFENIKTERILAEISLFLLIIFIVFVSVIIFRNEPTEVDPPTDTANEETSSG
jgi:hypothetical protein